MERALKIAKTCEGFHRVTVWKPEPMAVPYLCPAGFWTQAWGHLCARDAAPVTMAQGEELLLADMAVAATAVLRLVTWPLTPGQFEALVDWTFNLGSGRLRGSTLRQVVNRGELASAPGEMRKWVWGGGQKLPGLVLRREAEVALWLSG